MTFLKLSYPANEKELEPVVYNLENAKFKSIELTDNYLDIDIKKNVKQQIEHDMKIAAPGWIIVQIIDNGTEIVSLKTYVEKDK